jgi:hypothetical protein
MALAILVRVVCKLSAHAFAHPCGRVIAELRRRRRRQLPRCGTLEERRDLAGVRLPVAALPPCGSRATSFSPA